MELFTNVSTAQELFEFLKTIPEEQRKRLPVELGDEEMNILHTGDINISAFETTETQGNIERGFRLERSI